MRPIIFGALAVLLLAGMPQSCLAEVEVDAEVRAALAEVPGVVALVLTGHYHPGGYAAWAPPPRDDGNGGEGGGSNVIHFVGLEGLVEAPPGLNAYAVVDVHADRLEVTGFGCAASRTLAL